jgi:alginate O-acetyltransferase complex protein AlgI
MVFSSIVFLLYFLPLFLLCYTWAPRKAKNVVILLFSIVFYSWGAPRFIFVILGTTLLDFHLVRLMDSMAEAWKRKALLALSLLVNLGLLLYFKYSNFFIENLNGVLALGGMQGLHWTKLVLPIGISFYTFETITYVVDVYRKVHRPLPNFWDYQLYIILFPKLIAGPIVRYHDLAGQIEDRQKHETADNRLQGLYRFTLGLAKKVLIANHVGAFADQVFAAEIQGLGSASAWLGLLAYTLQIYFDFSGYSDMALGLAQTMGFRLPENFNNPYVSGSITEFWRRWHMTLGAWMREYLYIPLGGNRGPGWRTYLNLWLVFLASGIWHGASWSFVVWGAYHGLFLVLERSFLLRVYQKMGPWIPRLITFGLVMLGWAFFRIESLNQALEFMGRLFAFETGWTVAAGAEVWARILPALIFAFWVLLPKGQALQNAVYFGEHSGRRHVFLSAMSLVLWWLCLSGIAGFSFNPFIYFRF